MGHTLRYFEWKKNRWLSLRSERAESNTPPPADVQRDLDAYACRQANIYEGLIISFVNWWRKLLASYKSTPDWLTKYPATVDPPSLHPSTRLPSAQTRPGTGAANESLDMVCEPPHHPSPTEPSGEDLDRPLVSEVETDDDDDYTIDKADTGGRGGVTQGTN